MTPERNQTDRNQSGQDDSQTSNTNVSAEKYRPDWIIPDNGSSSRKNTETDSNKESANDRQENSSIPMDNDDTLGIP